jgi:large exoprotein involved in heme utilization and adhesion
MFGPNASLDVQGSFHVSTADELRFADGATFSATNPDASSLTVAAPEAFGFLGGDPADIAVDNSTIRVPGDEPLSIVGGHLSVADSALAAPAGAIHLVSAASPTGVRVTDGVPAWVDGGDIEITRSASSLEAMGAGQSVFAAATSSSTIGA